ncbi:MAG: CopG family transcriptional regulator [Planctomycetota bacterium]|nr:MAG: CopG family transcriptional regulator [Planctomycetota bacterium]
MPRRKSKYEIVTFKADRSLLDALSGIQNRSEFIRTAVLAALDHLCPLCQGTGVMTPNQRRHWTAFARQHALRECDECHERHLVCEASDQERFTHE